MSEDSWETDDRIFWGKINLKGWTFILHHMNETKDNNREKKKAKSKKEC